MTTETPQPSFDEAKFNDLESEISILDTRRTIMKSADYYGNLTVAISHQISNIQVQQEKLLQHIKF